LLLLCLAVQFYAAEFDFKLSVVSPRTGTLLDKGVKEKEWVKSGKKDRWSCQLLRTAHHPPPHSQPACIDFVPSLPLCLSWLMRPPSSLIAYSLSLCSLFFRAPARSLARLLAA
jgi:hypothetical protein